MELFLAGIVIFVGVHVFTAVSRGRRDAIVTKLGGEGRYKGAFALTALIGLALIIAGWRNADASVIYATPYWMRHVTYLLVLIAFVLFVAAEAPAGRIAETVKHPMLVGTKVWAFAHLLVNGEVRSVILFGSLLAFAVIDRIAVKRRGVITRHAGPNATRNDMAVIGIAVTLYAIVALFAHRWIAGVALF